MVKGDIGQLGFRQTHVPVLGKKMFNGECAS
jgi:hypothetical protein